MPVRIVQNRATVSRADHLSTSRNYLALDGPRKYFRKFAAIVRRFAGLQLFREQVFIWVFRLRPWIRLTSRAATAIVHLLLVRGCQAHLNTRDGHAAFAHGRGTTFH
jgi:hypothetical protein